MASQDLEWLRNDAVDHVALMHSGVVVAAGPRAEIAVSAALRVYLRPLSLDEQPPPLPLRELRTVWLLSLLDEDQLVKVATLAHPRAIDARATLAEPPTAVAVCTSGGVELLDDDSADAVGLTELSPGGAIGLAALIGEADGAVEWPRHRTRARSSGAMLLELPADCLDRALARLNTCLNTSIYMCLNTCLSKCVCTGV